MSSVPRESLGLPGRSAYRPPPIVVWVVLSVAGVLAIGCAIAKIPMLALLICALALVVLATPFVEGLSVLIFWLLPYLILNVPAGGLTLKVPEVTAYLFATSVIVRALLRRELISLPPATPQVLIYLGVLALSAAVAPPVPVMFRALFSGIQGPDLRPWALLFWLALSWMVVVSLYHIVGTSPNIFRRCVLAHVLGGTLASLIGIIGYVVTLGGYGALASQTIGHGHTFVFTGGSFYRLTGVSYEPLAFAFYLNTVLPVTIAVALFRQVWLPRWLLASALALQGLALLLTFSAGGWATILVELVLMACLYRPPRAVWGRLRPMLLSLGLLVGLAVVLCFTNPILARSAGDALGKITNGGYKMRTDELITGLHMFQDHIWLGVGPSLVPFYQAVYHPTYRDLYTSPDPYIANQYVTTLAESGVVGMAALAACGIAGLWALGVEIRRHGPSQVPMLTALTVALIGCAIQYGETINLFWIYFTAVVGLAVAGVRLARRGAEPL